MRTRHLLLLSTLVAAVSCLLAIPGLVRATHASPQWIVHEWGTFTCLQDESGQPIGGINTDDEPLPSFVHYVAQDLITPDAELPLNVLPRNKGIRFNRRCFLPVTMRLETPVLYFYPPEEGKIHRNVDVKVRFNGGWLSEFYPDAIAVAPGIDSKQGVVGELTSSTVGTLSWEGLTVGGDADGPETESPVWLAPRGVRATSVANKSGEKERYLFYRGVGHLNSPLRVIRRGGALDILADSSLSNDGSGIAGCWLVCIRADRALAFCDLGTAKPGPDVSLPLYKVDDGFVHSDFRDGSLVRLKESMHKALVADGLYDDEATAMLNTWESSYFKTPGTRLFYLVPQRWTDRVLPLQLSVPSTIERVMVGRIELVTPEHRELIARVAAGSDTIVAEASARSEWLKREWLNLTPGRPYNVHDLYEAAHASRIRALELVPENYRAYSKMGRFRDAILLNAIQRSSDAIQRAKLEAFTSQYGVWYYGSDGAKLAKAVP